MKNDRRAERGEVASWLVVLAALVAAALLAASTLQPRLSDLAAGVGQSIAGVDTGVHRSDGLEPGTDTLQAANAAAPDFRGRSRWIGRPRPSPRPGTTGFPIGPPPGGSPDDGPDNGSGGYDDTPIEDALRNTIEDLGDLVDDLTEPGPSSQDELFDSQHEALEDAGYTRTGTDEHGGAIFTHSSGQSTRVLTRVPGGGVHIEHTRNAPGTENPAAITFVTIGTDGTRTERMQSFQYDSRGNLVGSTETIVQDGVVTSRYTNQQLEGGATQQVWETPEGWTEQVTHPDGRIIISGYDVHGNLLSQSSVVRGSGGGGNNGDGDTSNQNGNGNNSLTQHDESDSEDYCGSCGDNTGGYDDVGNSDLSGAAG